jgi:subfamily B ATP-binding cassette protein MsbA
MGRDGGGETLGGHIKVNRLASLWSFLEDSRVKVVMSFAALTFVSLTSLLFPWLLKLMVDQLTLDISTVGLGIMAGVLLTVVLLSTVAGYFQQIAMQKLGIKLRNGLRQSYYDSLLHRAMGFHRKHRVGALSEASTEEIGKIQLLFTQLLAPIYQNALFIVGCLILMMALHWQATFIVAFLIAVPAPFIYAYSRRIRSSSAESQTLHARANAFFEETLVGIREIKAFDRERVELRRYSVLLQEASRMELDAARLHVKVNQSIYFLLSAMLLGVFLLGTSRTVFPHWSLGSVIAFYFYAYTLTMALISVGRIYLTYQNFLGALDRVFDSLEHEESSPRLTSKQWKGTVHGTIKLEGVCFSYEPAHTVLHELSFESNAGSWVLITGASGSGKSTIANLLVGLYEPEIGNVLVDNVPLSDWDRSTLLKQIGYVGQEPLLFHGTLRENILFSGNGISESRLVEVLEVCCLKDFVSKLPDGLDTIIGERGYTLSGGQKARVAIARAIIFEPSILILDEPTSMLEHNLVIELWNNLAGFRRDRTTIVLSHRREKIPIPYRRFVLTGGRLEEIVSQNFEAKPFANVAVEKR